MSRPRMRRRTRVILAAAVLTPVLVAGIGEFAARSILRDRVTAAASRAVSGDFDVETGSGWAVVHLMDGTIPSITLSSDNAQLRRISDAHLEITLEDVQFAGGARSVAQSHVEVDIPAHSILELARTSAQGLPVQAVRTDPTSDTVVLDAGVGEAILKPEVRSGRVVMTVADVQVFGASRPRMKTKLQASLSDAAGQQAYPLGLRATSAEVTDSGVHAVLEGGEAELPRTG